MITTPDVEMILKLLTPKKDLNKNKFFNKSLTDYNNIFTLGTGRKLRTTNENEKLFNVKDSITTFKKKLRNYLLQTRN